MANTINSTNANGSTSGAPNAASPNPPAPATPGKPALVVDTEIRPTRAPAFEIHSNVNITRYLKAMFYGEYGSGKTLLAGTSVGVPQMRDVLMVSAESGELTLYEPDGPYPFHLIDIVHVTNYSTSARVYDFLKAHCSGRDRAQQGDPKAISFLKDLQQKLMPHVPDPDRLRLYRTVIVDSLSEVEVFCMYQLLGVTEDTGMDEESSSPEWAEYNRQRNMIHRLIRNYRNLPMNSIFTCARQFRENEQKRRIYGPQMTGKLSGEVQGFMDLVGHLIVGEPPSPSDDDPDPTAPRRLLIQPGPRHSAKNRFKQFKKSYWDDPTIPRIMRDVGLLNKEEQN